VSNLRAFPRKHRKGARLPNPEAMAGNSRCIACGAYGCLPRLVNQGSDPTGDNVMPLCRHHHDASLIALYMVPAVQTWLKDHDRHDVVLELERQIASKLRDPFGVEAMLAKCREGSA
jgi:hypothetical protein